MRNIIENLPNLKQRNMSNGMILEQQKSTVIMVTCMCAKSFQSCPTLCNAVDYCSMRGFSIHEILQTRMLEWVGMPSSRGSSQPRDQTCICYVSCTVRQVLHHQNDPGSPITVTPYTRFLGTTSLPSKSWHNLCYKKLHAEKVLHQNLLIYKHLLQGWT